MTTLPRPERMPHRLEDYYEAPSGRGPLAGEWRDKPHRLLYELIKHIAWLEGGAIDDPPPPAWLEELNND